MYLISRGADWRHRDKDGDTALHFACLKELPQGQHEKTLEYLLTTPLSQLKDAQNVSGETPLNTACKWVVGLGLNLMQIGSDQRVN